MKFADKTARSYQVKVVEQIRDVLEKDPIGRILIKQPTGTGKTMAIALVMNDSECQSILLNGKERKTLRVVYKAHRYSLLSQAKKLFEQEPNFKTVTQDHWIDNNDIGIEGDVEVCFMVLSEKLKDVDIDLFCHDEAHHEACNTAQEFLEIAGKFPCIGMTATPDRADSLLIKFNHIVETLSRKDAVSNGYICATDIKTIVDTHNKDKVSLLCEVFDVYKKEFGQTIVFMRTLKEVQLVAEYITRQGFSCVGITNQKDVEIDQILQDFSDGKYQFVVNANRLGEGIDCKGVTDVLIGKHIGSYTDLNQYIGRACRIDEDDCRVWEFVSPLAGDNLDSTVVVGKPKSHVLIYKKAGQWHECDF